MNYKIVSTMGPGSWAAYGKRMVKSVRQHWPAAQLEIWTHDCEQPTYDGVVFKTLDSVPAFQNLKQALGGVSDQMGLQYCFKAVALANAVTPDLDWVGFIDADVEFMQPVDDALLTELFDSGFDLTYLYRRGIKESEGSWFAFNLQTPAGANLLADFYGMYASREFQHLKKQHDNAVLDRLVTLHQAHGLRVKNLAPGSLGLDAFHQSMLGAYAVHYKGPNKNTVADPGLGCPARYDMLADFVKHSCKVLGTANLVEVGTWNGSRAIQMAEAAFSTGVPAVNYVGFDTFEDGNDRAHEGHTKPHAVSHIVRRRLENYAALQHRLGREFTFALVMGNTLETMPAAAGLLANTTFAYVDGGHSYETTLSDYNAVKHAAYVIFDDVIQQPEEGAPEGPIRVWKEATGQKTLFQSMDGYAGLSQAIALGVVVRPELPMPNINQPLVVKPVDSVDKAEQFRHITENTRAIKQWLKPYQAHSKLAILVSAGPSLSSFYEDIREKQKAGGVVFAVKHALPELLAQGIRPDYTVLLDPRPVTGASTHGIKRTNLFKDVGPNDKFLMATMTHPSVRKYLAKQRAQIIGWHAFTQSSQDADLPEFKIGTIVNGGTCAATRMPLIAFMMGFRRLDFYGYDMHYPEGIDQSKLKQQLIKITVGQPPHAKDFLTTGELVAAIQDTHKIIQWMVQNQFTVRWFGDGAGPTVWRQTVGNYTAPEEYPE